MSPILGFQDMDRVNYGVRPWLSYLAYPLQADEHDFVVLPRYTRKRPDIKFALQDEAADAVTE